MAKNRWRVVGEVEKLADVGGDDLTVVLETVAVTVEAYTEEAAVKFGALQIVADMRLRYPGRPVIWHGLKSVECIGPLPADQEARQAGAPMLPGLEEYHG